MKPASTAVREAFIKRMQLWHQSRLESVEQRLRLTGREREIYNWAFRAGFEDGVGVAISATDSREDNGAQYRIVDLNGDFIPFYDEGYSDLGLIVSIFPR